MRAQNGSNMVDRNMIHGDIFCVEGEINVLKFCSFFCFCMVVLTVQKKRHRTINFTNLRLFANYILFFTLLNLLLYYDSNFVIFLSLLLGMEDDAEFHEHIFLEKHLESFPKQGPIRHFMELVICGLSKNPYLSVKQKIEHIEWFQKYFEEKKEFLQEIWNLGKVLNLEMKNHYIKTDDFLSWKYCQCIVIMWPESCILNNKLKGHTFMSVCPCICRYFLTTKEGTGKSGFCRMCI